MAKSKISKESKINFAKHLIPINMLYISTGNNIFRASLFGVAEKKFTQ